MCRTCPASSSCLSATTTWVRAMSLMRAASASYCARIAFASSTAPRRRPSCTGRLKLSPTIQRCSGMSHIELYEVETVTSGYDSRSARSRARLLGARVLPRAARCRGGDRPLRSRGAAGVAVTSAAAGIGSSFGGGGSGSSGSRCSSSFICAIVTSRCEARMTVSCSMCVSSNSACSGSCAAARPASNCAMAAACIERISST